MNMSIETVELSLHATSCMHICVLLNLLPWFLLIRDVPKNIIYGNIARETIKWEGTMERMTDFSSSKEEYKMRLNDIQGKSHSSW